MADRNRDDSVERIGDSSEGSVEGTSDSARDAGSTEREREPLTFREPRKTEVPDESNPPRTTTGNFTAPKFGSAGSGGAELEPGPERD